MEELIERLRHFYEIDLDICNMTNELGIEVLAQAMHDKNYKKNFIEQHEEYKKVLNN